MTGPLVPFREVVLKVHSRCDLACDHCYIYEHADQSWRTRPKSISDEAISWTARRLAEHASEHALDSMSVILHGGEPLLAGPARLRRVCEELTSALNGIAELDLRIHTNGVQLSPRYLDLFDEFGVKVGISLDGDRTANDRHRVFANGRSSHPLVLRAVELLRQDRYRHLDLGLLCTIDIRNDPVEVFDALAELDPPQVDFLLPHATWDEPPLRPDGSPTAYADWLLAVFDRWAEQGQKVPVRLFSSVLSTLSGGPSLTESLGLAPTDLVVIETDGQLEQVDSLKSAYEGAAATGFDVFSHSFDDVAAHPGVRARQLGLAGVSETCRACPVVRSCGGGLYTHRYRSSNGFDNPSVYCTDLATLVRAVEERATASIGSRAVAEPAELAEAGQDLNRTLLAALHAGIGERGHAYWDQAWELAAEAEGTERGAGALDEVLGHPYTRTWLLDAQRAPEDPAHGARAAGRLAASVAAAAVLARLELTVPVPFDDGRLFLPTLGEVRIGEPGERGRALVRAAGEGFEVGREGSAGATRVAAIGEEAADWSPLRLVGGDGGPGFVLDDLDPYRDCFDAPVASRLTPHEAAEWGVRLVSAWELLRRKVPEQAAEAARALVTLTPLATGPTRAGGHGYGALGLGVDGGDDELALALLRGFRRTKFLALVDVTDLYAADGEWEHRPPWSQKSLPFSRLLSDTFERVGTGLFEPRFLDGIREALDMIEAAPELTVDGARAVAGLRKELAGSTHGTSGEEKPRDRFRARSRVAGRRTDD
ncbi:radical SAM/SPASM protein FxsBH, inactivated beta-hydroxylase extension form [Streptomyces pratensis]|uniref:radical SAM/SPASM protein FxsBH, inactivated beta-hydroxylase extension form n=1 Tax=Streptomyces pratensis TaxID=1169025 RepID=UPI001933092B|nr:radical SAM/SPASM protein FxsB, inactivated metallohydrolase extension form [Streptomyces pratensis]